MRRPVCLAVLGISIVVAAISLGVTLTRYIGLRAYSPKGTAQTDAPPPGRTAPVLPAKSWNNLFAPGDGMKLASRLPAVNAKTGSSAQRSAFVLVGTIVSSSPSARRAILWANGMKEPKAFREKEEVEPGAFLSSVERDKAWITRGNEREKLEILPVGSQGRPAATTAARPAAPSAAAAAPPPALPTDTSARPFVAPVPQPSPGRTRALTVPGGTSGDEDEESLTPRQRRRRALGLGR